MEPSSEASPNSSQAPEAVPHQGTASRSAHEQRELEKKEREEKRRQEDQERQASKSRKSMVWKLVCVLVAASLAYWIYGQMASQEKPFTSGEVHWHTKLEMSICGQVKNLPRAPPGASHFGNALLHTHDDDIVHVEGRVWKKESITLGNFFDAINVPFSETRFFEKKNGDLCDGKPGRVRMWVDGAESTEFRNLLSLDGQNVKIAFEP